jgi:hypothetical protein
VIVSLRRSVRSLWSSVIVLVGVLFCVLGVAMGIHPADFRGRPTTYLSGVVLGLGCFTFGLVFSWGGARMGVFPDGDGMLVRPLFGSATTYPAAEISGFTTREVSHDSTPLMLVQPCILLEDGSEELLSGLSAYRVFPGAQRQATRAVTRMSEWTRKPIRPT